MNDPLLQTLLEEDRILSKSKQGGLASSYNQEKPKDNPSEHSSDINDYSSQGSLDKGKPFENSVGESGSSNEESGAASLPANIVPIDEKEIIQNRLSLEQIKEIPKFTNYHPGEPNKVSVLIQSNRGHRIKTPLFKRTVLKVSQFISSHIYSKPRPPSKGLENKYPEEGC